MAALLQRQLGETPLDVSAAPGVPPRGTRGYPRSVEVNRIPPAWEALEYPPVPAPDPKGSYSNWHRVRELTVWFPLAVGRWEPADGGDYWKRPIKWGRFRVSRTETWLIRGTATYVSKTEGVTYVERKPFKTKTFVQEVSKPPPAGASWRPSSEYPLHLGGGSPPLDNPTQPVVFRAWFEFARAIPRMTSELAKAVGLAALAPGARGFLGVASQPGWQLVSGGLLRVWLSGDPVLRASFEANEASWVRSVPAPRRTLIASGGSERRTPIRSGGSGERNPIRSGGSGD